MERRHRLYNLLCTFFYIQNYAGKESNFLTILTAEPIDSINGLHNLTSYFQISCNNT